MKTLITSAMILIALALIAQATNTMLDDSISQGILPLLCGVTLLIVGIFKIRAPLLVRFENRTYSI